MVALKICFNYRLHVHAPRTLSAPTNMEPFTSFEGKSHKKYAFRSWHGEKFVNKHTRQPRSIGNSVAYDNDDEDSMRYNDQTSTSFPFSHWLHYDEQA